MDHGGRPPIGLALWETARLVLRAFNRTLAEHGGNRAMWALFRALDQAGQPTQRELAQAIGITEATLTHHLTGLERRGLVTRYRDEQDRRVQRIQFTEAGRAAFAGMAAAAKDFDDRLRAALGPEGVASLLAELSALVAAVTPLDDGGPDDGGPYEGGSEDGGPEDGGPRQWWARGR
ncbi:MAG: winged helix-turn-helix transcriptional regulator [Micromonosporaceae bacterium]|nr:winged helix-turn-helix transcriptional regulator [Micromonosporaceae bacterium]